MMSTKFTTKAWGHAQEPSYKSDGLRYEPAKADPSQTAGSASAGQETGEKIGEVLNRIADPTGSDAAKKEAMRKPNTELGKDDFLKLMLAQMKNQDPVNPMQTHEMASQLAQFTSLEQLFNVNKNLEGLKKQADPSIRYQALNFIGKAVRADSRIVFKDEGVSPTDIRFDLKGDAQNVKIKITDENGLEVRTIDVPDLKKGIRSVTWQGLDSEEKPAKAGRYNVEITAEASNGSKIAVETQTRGTITGVNYTAQGPMLMVGSQKVRLQDIQEIVDEQLDQVQKAIPEPVSGGKEPTGQQTQAVPVSAAPKVKKEAEIKTVSPNYDPKKAMAVQVEGGSVRPAGSIGQAMIKGG